MLTAALTNTEIRQALQGQPVPRAGNSDDADVVGLLDLAARDTAAALIRPALTAGEHVDLDVLLVSD